jgi:thymidylate synthase (FAD)
MPKIVKARILDVIGLENPESVIGTIEHCGRIAYMTWDKESPVSADKFVRMIVKLGHESVLEHKSVTAVLECDRATAQQITRHRIASFTMQSQRYCNFASDKFGNEVTFVDPEFGHKDKEAATAVWLDHVKKCEDVYLGLVKSGCPPEDARSVLPNSAACVIAVTANLREWRHIFKLRTDPHAQHNIRNLTCALLRRFSEALPCVFFDLVETV